MFLSLILELENNARIDMTFFGILQQVPSPLTNVVGIALEGHVQPTP